ncbi:chromosome segregation protein SMC [Rhodoferax sp. 4810]|uniref:Chromosome partition protein Smc n=1 Tax=Thiospirillum jenense TaxID=1653858 RepID=A0A839H7W0_9GAMM|nr:chromosome segregation protein SMC [Thiospirillum jenense]MBB1073831.1 chromosome segregation protein SMC [Rhodoferax jenense]MBB1125214.1 chromosome segregation protein SMC [Thiospirillum jenense]
MRLEKIKLVGFKSFVDPTTIPLPSNLIGVVGPNGCGKSNVIDAVRWVMGESSAKMLRGAGMADVIFNGAAGRQPATSANIELVFDNRTGRAGGAYAALPHIAVRRQVGRDGQSSYFLNGTRCRRRDIYELFLGTGLGPRSYAIIEQGMVSRFIEARPEDLRAFIEEAAGISKYKERRRETETRLDQTRDNLARLTDVRTEVAKQCAHLERQAAQAVKFQTLQVEQQRIKLELLALTWQAFNRSLASGEAALATAALALETTTTAWQDCDAQLDEHRTTHAQVTDDFNAMQAAVYQAAAEVARLQSALAFADRERQRQVAELQRLTDDCAAAAVLSQRDAHHLSELDAELAELMPQLAAAELATTAADQAVTTAALAQEAWQVQSDAVQMQLTAPQQQMQQSRRDLAHLEPRLAHDQARLTWIQAELRRLADLAEVAECHALAAELEAVEQQLTAATAAQAAALAAVQTVARERHAASQQLDLLRTELHTVRGRVAALESLIAAARDSNAVTVTRWLEQHQLHTAPRLLDLIRVTPGYETAVESALAEALAAVGSDQFPAHASSAGDCAGVMLFDCQLAAAPAALTDLPRDSLLHQVATPETLLTWLAAFRYCEDVASALAQRHTLSAHERFVTRSGIIVGRDWFYSPARDGSAGKLRGSLARLEELTQLQRRYAELTDRQAELLEATDWLAERQQLAEMARDAALSEVATHNQQRAALSADLSAAQAHSEHHQLQQAALQVEGGELQRRIEETLAAISEAHEILDQASQALAALDVTAAELLVERDRHRGAVTTTRAMAQQCQARVRELQLTLATLQATRSAVVVSLERAQTQLLQTQQVRESLAAAVTDGAAPLVDLQQALDEQRQRHQELEQQCAQVKLRVTALQREIQAREQQRHTLAAQLTQRREELTSLQGSLQDTVVRRRLLEEELAALNSEATAVLATVAAEATIDRWTERLAAGHSKLARLGNVNLAAADEYREQAERLHYLDTQQQDIQAALAALQSAIKAMDRETRSRFTTTFDQLNQQLQQLFPRLFGGGQAELIPTSQDLLTAGVTIMARPPGKRNANIHQLSGGEKALTAIALVFAIFQLNPAPFCLLDEVDAPLDDANVGRFCQLVKALSEQVQFIFITHNKTTMEIADHLLGVTMHEPGVSRLVAVDVSTAAALGAAD